MTSPREQLLEHALSLPEAWADQPWEDDDVVKVRKKIFVFLGGPESTGISIKLTDSLELGRAVPGAEPTGYGLGRHGWTHIPITGEDAPPVEVLVDWLEESYCAVAPKTLARRLTGLGGET